MITTELEKPDNASSGVNIWKISKAVNEQSATMSERNLPFTKKMAASTNITMVIHIGV